MRIFSASIILFLSVNAFAGWFPYQNDKNLIGLFLMTEGKGGNLNNYASGNVNPIGAMTQTNSGLGMAWITGQEVYATNLTRNDSDGVWRYEVAEVRNYQTCSICGEMKPRISVTGNAGALFNHGSGCCGGTYMGFNFNSGRIEISDPVDGEIPSTIVLTSGTWHRVCVVRDYNRKVLSFFVDGVKDASMTVISATALGDINSSKPCIGAVNCNTPNPTDIFDGAIGWVAVWDRALSDGEGIQITARSHHGSSVR